MPIGITIILLQVAFAIHAIHTGKDRMWLWIIIFVPAIGCALYFITQFGPEAANSRTARDAKRRLVAAVDPQRELRKRMTSLEVSNTVENRVALAEECREAGLFDEAIPLLKGSLSGLTENDPQIMELLAKAQFESGDADAAVSTLDELIKRNPDYNSIDGHLLYARSLEAMGNLEDACREYEALTNSYTGEEARVRYAMLLKRLGRNEHAATMFRESLVRAKHAPKHYAKKEREWLKIAQRES